MKEQFKKLIESLTDTQKGIIYIIAGVILLLYSFDIIGKGIDTLITIGAIGMIIYGFFLAKFHIKLQQILKKHEK